MFHGNMVTVGGTWGRLAYRAKGRVTQTPLFVALSLALEFTSVSVGDNN